MSRESYVYRDGKVVPKHLADDRGVKRVNGVISDSLGGQLEHHGYADGRRTDSKSTFRRWTREAGLVEKGNDRVKTERNFGGEVRDVVRDVATATNMVKNGYKPQIRWREDG